MNTTHFSIKRLLLAGGLALGVFGTAALSGPTANAQPAPISPLKVLALGTEATISFATAEPAAVTVAAKAAAPTAGAQSPVQGYATTHQRTLTGLKSNTSYDVTVTAQTQRGQTHTATTRFTTAKQRVRVTLREINVTEDGDIFWMDGEPAWFVRLAWAGAETGGCYPNNGNICETDSRGEGRFVPKNSQGQPLMWLFAEENFDTMPTSFELGAAGLEYDIVPVLPNVVNCFHKSPSGTCGYGSDLDYDTERWQVPTGQDWASTAVFVYAGKGGQGFDSTMAFTFELFHDNLSYPSERNMPRSTWTR